MITLARITHEFYGQENLSYSIFLYWLRGVELRVYTELGDDILLARLVKNKIVVEPIFLEKLKR